MSHGLPKLLAILLPFLTTTLPHGAKMGAPPWHHVGAPSHNCIMCSCGPRFTPTSPNYARSPCYTPASRDRKQKMEEGVEAQKLWLQEQPELWGSSGLAGAWGLQRNSFCGPHASHQPPVGQPSFYPVWSISTVGKCTSASFIQAHK